MRHAMSTRYFYAAVLALLALSSNAFAQTAATVAAIASRASTQPEFIGDVRTYLADKVSPPDSIAERTNLRFAVAFIVTEDGSIDSVWMKRSTGDAGYDSEIIRVVRQMPRWKPATENGKPVKSYFTVPVRICPF